MQPLLHTPLSSGAHACTQAYPLDLVRTRLSAQTKAQYYRGIAHALRTIVADEGARGLYRCAAWPPVPSATGAPPSPDPCLHAGRLKHTCSHTPASHVPTPEGLAASRVVTR